MTHEDDLVRVDSVIDSAHVVAADSLSMGRKTIKSLVADSRALRELVEALPNCVSPLCDRKATHGYAFVLGSSYGPSCDAHVSEFADQQPLRYAALMRKMGL